MNSAAWKRWVATQLKDKSCIVIFLSFLAGFMMGSFGRTATPSHVSAIRRVPTAHSGSVYHLSDTPVRNTAHVDRLGRPITKQQFVEPFEVPNVAGFSVATLLPGQDVSSHQHESMHEFFYILEGKGVFIIDGKEESVEPGTFLHIAPHEKHRISVPVGGAKMKILLSGVVVE